MWCRAVDAPLAEFVREFDVTPSAQEAQEMADSQNTSSGVPNALCALPELLMVENARQSIKHTIEVPLGITKVRAFVTGDPTTLGLSVAASTGAIAPGADKHGECTLLYPTAGFIVVARAFEGALVAQSALQLQLELVLDRFTPQLSHEAVEKIMSAHPGGAAWMADCND